MALLFVLCMFKRVDEKISKRYTDSTVPGSGFFLLLPCLYMRSQRYGTCDLSSTLCVVTLRTIVSLLSVWIWFDAGMLLHVAIITFLFTELTITKGRGWWGWRYVRRRRVRGRRRCHYASKWHGGGGKTFYGSGCQPRIHDGARKWPHVHPAGSSHSGACYRNLLSYYHSSAHCQNGFVFFRAIIKSTFHCCVCSFKMEALFSRALFFSLF